MGNRTSEFAIYKEKPDGTLVEVRRFNSHRGNGLLPSLLRDLGHTHGPGRYLTVGDRGSWWRTVTVTTQEVVTGVSVNP